MIAYHLQQVEFAYENGPAVLSLPELVLPEGEITAFVGPNGCGKTTLLHLLSFLYNPTRGTLRFFGDEVGPRRLIGPRRQVSLLLQSPYLFRRSVIANVEWAMRARGIRGSRLRNLAMEALQRVGMQQMAQRSARELSGGERQRVALARVIALAPRVVCLDEPTNHLDVSSQRLLEDLLREWVEKEGVTVFMATHDERLAYRLGARMWRMEHGRLQVHEDGSNVFFGHLVQAEPPLFQVGSVHLRGHELPAGTRCVLISPRQVLVARELQQHSARNQLQGRIVGMEELPDGEMKVSMNCGLPLVAIITRESWEELGLTVGGDVVASFKVSATQAC